MPRRRLTHFGRSLNDTYTICGKATLSYSVHTYDPDDPDIDCPRCLRELAKLKNEGSTPTTDPMVSRIRNWGEKGGQGFI